MVNSDIVIGVLPTRSLAWLTFIE